MTNLPVLYLASAAFLILMSAAVFVFSRMLAARNPTSTPTPPPRLNFRPMTRLLSTKDFEFLSQQPGYNPGLAKQLRSERVRLMRTYLDQLAVEFDRLHIALRLLTAYASVDRPEVAHTLLQQKVVFAYRMTELRVRVLWFGFGVQPADFTVLVEAVEGLRTEVARLSQPLAIRPAMVAI